jgi:hypothetical protein
VAPRNRKAFFEVAGGRVRVNGHQFDAGDLGD